MKVIVDDTVAEVQTGITHHVDVAYHVTRRSSYTTTGTEWLNRLSSIRVRVAVVLCRTWRSNEKAGGFDPFNGSRARPTRPCAAAPFRRGERARVHRAARCPAAGRAHALAAPGHPVIHRR